MAKVLLLIVEDEEALAELYSANFKQAGFDVDIAHDGLEGFEKMKNEHPSLVLMDILMPGLSGVEALEKAKHDPLTRNIPVVMLTNYADSVDLQNAMKQGALDYIVKSQFTPAQVVEKAQKILGSLPKPDTGQRKYLTS